MKGSIAIVLMICSPFLVGGLILLVIKLQDVYQQFKYENALAERDAKLVRYGMKTVKYSDEKDAYPWL